MKLRRGTREQAASMCAERHRLSTAMHQPSAAHTAAALTVEPRAHVLHIGARRAHARGLPAMLQLCSPSMSRPAQIKEKLELDVEEHRRIAERYDTRTASGRVVTVGDLPRRSARGPQLVLRVGGSNHPHPVSRT